MNIKVINSEVKKISFLKYILSNNDLHYIVRDLYNEQFLPQNSKEIFTILSNKYKYKYIKINSFVDDNINIINKIYLNIPKYTKLRWYGDVINICVLPVRWAMLRKNNVLLGIFNETDSADEYLELITHELVHCNIRNKISSVTKNGYVWPKALDEYEMDVIAKDAEELSVVLITRKIIFNEYNTNLRKYITELGPQFDKYELTTKDLSDINNQIETNGSVESLYLCCKDYLQTVRVQQKKQAI